MSTLKQLTDDPEQVNRIIRWWVLDVRYRYHKVMLRGTLNDFINDVWCKLLRNIKPDREYQFTISTIVISHCGWTMFFNNGRTEENQAKHKSFLRRMREHEQLRPNHRIDPKHVLFDRLETNELYNAIESLIPTLTSREALIIKRRYGLCGEPESTLEDVGASLLITRERVRQIESKAISKLKHHTMASALFSFVNLPDTDELDKAACKKMQKTEYGEALFEELTKDIA